MNGHILLIHTNPYKYFLPFLNLSISKNVLFLGSTDLQQFKIYICTLVW